MTTTTLTPPPLPPQSGQPAQPGHTPPSERRSSSRVVAIIAICLGAVLVLGTVVTGVISIIRTAAVHTTTLTASIDGIRALDIDARAADVDIVYGDVAEATLRVVGSQGDWTFERQGDTLVVSSDRQWWGRWGWFREGDDVTLTLPTGTRGLDADFDVDGGSLTATGDYGDLALTLDAGSLRIEGSAESLTTDVSAGSARLELSGVDTATVSVSAGSVDGRLLAGTTEAPSSVSVDVSAGRVDLALPDATYAVTSDVSAGGFTNRLDTASASQHRVDVTVSAGAVVLRSGR